MFADRPDLLIGARKGSPLILGIGKVQDVSCEGKTDSESDVDTDPSAAPASPIILSGEAAVSGVVRECFLASDASAIIEYTNKVCAN